MKVLDDTAIDTLVLRATEAESLLGGNLVWLSDKFDLSIRQKDAEVIQVMEEIRNSWLEMCHILQIAKILQSIPNEPKSGE